MASLRTPVVLVALIATLALGATVAADIALLRFADHPRDRVGRLQMRLDHPPAATGHAATPRLVVTSPPRPRTDGAGESRDD